MLRTWIEVNIENLKSNINYLKKITNNKLMPVLKSNAYGIGFEIISELIKEDQDIKILAVSFFDEAKKLLKLGLKKDILILNYVFPELLKDIKNKNLIFTIYSIDILNDLIETLKEDIKNYRFHIKFNTGMNRLGINEDEIEKLIKILKENKINVEAVFSHFLNAEDEKISKSQFDKFMKIFNKIKEFYPNIKSHIANSRASFLYENYLLDYSRIGMSIYGLQALNKKDENIKNIITWKSRISLIRSIKKGENIGYGNNFISNTDMKLAIVPIGYADGYPFMKNKGRVFIRGRYFNIIGEICMEQLIIDVSGFENLNQNEEVIIMGEKISAEEIAKNAGIISDVILSNINLNIKRIRVGD